MGEEKGQWLTQTAEVFGCDEGINLKPRSSEEHQVA